MFKDEILKNERRSRIYACIRKNPGLHLRQLQRNLNIPLASLQYHLNYMTSRRILSEEKDENRARYYCKMLEPAEKASLSILRQKRLREIIILLLINNKVNGQTIMTTLNLSASTISFYLKRLVEHNIVERTKVGYEYFYILKDEQYIEKVLIAHQQSLLDKMVDKWVSTWLEKRLVQDDSHNKPLE